MKIKHLCLALSILLCILLMVSCNMVPIETSGTSTQKPTSSTSSSTSSSSSSSSSSTSSSATTTVDPYDEAECYNHTRNRNTLSCTEYVDCSVCGEPIAPLGHYWMCPGVHTAGDCETKGYTTEPCARCSATRVVEDDTTAPHHYVNDACEDCGVSALVTIEQTGADTLVMPDRYNTGAGSIYHASETIIPVNGAGVYNGSKISGSTTGAMNLDTSGIDLSTTKEIVVSNLDLSNNSYFSLSDFGQNTDITIRFVNCIFKNIRSFRDGVNTKAKYIFDYCTIVNFGGSNATFNYCNFGAETDADAFNPMQNVYVNHCFVGNRPPIGYEKELHTDAVQIYGYGPGQRLIEAVNQRYYNFRCELPSIPYTGSHSYANSCLMISLDYNHADNITFEHCYINGTGCPIMIYDNPHPEFHNDTTPNHMTNILYRDIFSGCGSQFQTTVIKLVNEESKVTLGNREFGVGTSWIPNPTSIEGFETFAHSLYVGSVWEADGKTHISVSNDTNKVRNLRVFTNNGTYDLTVDRFPLYFELVRDTSYFELPLDIDFVIDGTFDWLVCYDVTDGNYQQVRYVNHTDEPVILNMADFTHPYANSEEVYEIAHGKIDASSKLDRTLPDKQAKMTGVFYTLTSDGTLVIYGQASDELVDGYRTYTMKNYSSADYKTNPLLAYKDLVKKVVVKPGITNIGAYLFYQMDAIESISLPSTVKTIGANAFYGCEHLKEVNIPYGVTNLGETAFFECMSLEEITVPSTITTMGKGVFNKCENLRRAVFGADVAILPIDTFSECYALEEVVLHAGITYVADYAFFRCASLEKIIFVGSEAECKAMEFDVPFNGMFAEMMHKPITYADESVIIEAEDRDLKQREPKGSTCTYKESSKVYDGLPVEVKFTTNSDGKVTYKWLKGSRILDGAPSDVGRYTLVIFIEETENFRSYEKHVAVFISAVKTTVTITSDGLDKAHYDGKPVENPTFTTNSNATPIIEWYVGDSLCSSNPTAPGTYRVVVRVPATQNFQSAQAEMTVTIGLPEGLTYWDGTTAQKFAGGTGTETDPYQIATAEQLAYLASLVNNADTNATYGKAYYVLTEDIYLNRGASAYAGWVNSSDGVNEWTAIGQSSELPFAGTFNGNNYTIYGLFGKAGSDAAENYHNGLFGYLLDAKVSNLQFQYVCFTSTSNSSCSGVLAAYAMGGTYTNITVRDTLVKAAKNAGGIFGAARSNTYNLTIGHCNVSADILSSVYSSSGLGGIVGSFGTGSRTYKTHIYDCVVKGRVEARGQAGGFIGGNAINHIILIENCINYANVTAMDGLASGIVTSISFNGGSYGATILNCANYGKITSTAGNNAAGIVSSISVAYSPVDILNCINYGDISSAQQYAGGIVARIEGSPNATVTLSNVISCGEVSAVAFANGLVGYLMPGGSVFVAENAVYVSDYPTNEGNVAGAVKMSKLALSDAKNFIEQLNAKAQAEGWQTWEQGSQAPKFTSKITVENANLDKYVDGKPVAVPEYTRHFGDGVVTFKWYKGTELLEGPPAEAGDYRLVITIAATQACGSDTVVIDFCLSDQGQPTLSISNMDKVYDGQPVATPTFTTTNTSATPTITFYQGVYGSGTLLASAPKDAGEYYVVIAIPASDGYDAITKYKVFTIAKAAGELSGTSDPTREYNGQPITLPTHSYNGTAPVTVTFYAGTYLNHGEALASAPVEVGQYVVIYTAPAEANYLGVELYYDFSIRPITSSVIISNNLTRPADGTPAAMPVYTHTNSGGTITVTWYDAEGTLLPEAPSAAGSYSVKVTLSAHGNYTEAEAIQYFDLYKTGTTWTGEMAASFAGGTGTETDPFKIATAEQLAYLAYLVNQVKSYSIDNGQVIPDGVNLYASAYYVLTADIVLNDNYDQYLTWATLSKTDGTFTGTAPANTWAAIGSATVAFSGQFDGQNHTIKGLYVKGNTAKNGGLFGVVEGKVTNLNVMYASVSNQGNGLAAGTIAAQLHQTAILENINVTHTIVQSTGAAGGIVGIACNKAQTHITLKNIHVDVTVISRRTAKQTNNVDNAGGIVGALGVHSAAIDLTNCSVKGSVWGGYGAAGVINCTSNANPEMIGYDVINYADVHAERWYAGGIGANFRSTSSTAKFIMYNAANYGNITGYTIAGGILSQISAIGGTYRLHNVANYGNVTVTCTDTSLQMAVGGLIGLSVDCATWDIKNCISAGTVSGSTYAGDIVGLFIQQEKSAGVFHSPSSAWKTAVVYYLNKPFGEASTITVESIVKITATDLSSSGFVTVLNEWVLNNTTEEVTYYHEWELIDGKPALKLN